THRHSPLSLHDALPILLRLDVRPGAPAEVLEERLQVILQRLGRVKLAVGVRRLEAGGPLRAPPDEIDGGLLLDADRSGTGVPARSEEHTSELQSRENLV